MPETKTRVYKGTSCSYNDTLLTILSEPQGINQFANIKAFKGSSTHDGDQVLTIKDGIIYKGSIPGISFQVGVIKDGKIFDAQETKQLGGYNKQDGVFYKDQNRLYSDHIATIKKGRLYKGKKIFTSEQIANAVLSDRSSNHEAEETALIVTAMHVLLGIGL